MFSKSSRTRTSRGPTTLCYQILSWSSERPNESTSQTSRSVKYWTKWIRANSSRLRKYYQKNHPKSLFNNRVYKCSQRFKLTSQIRTMSPYSRLFSRTCRQFSLIWLIKQTFSPVTETKLEKLKRRRRALAASRHLNNLNREAKVIIAVAWIRVTPLTNDKWTTKTENNKVNTNITRRHLSCSLSKFRSRPPL